MLTKILRIAAIVACALTPAESRSETLWFQNGSTIEQVAEVLSAMRGAEAYGLRSDDYKLALPAEAVSAVQNGSADARTRERFEAALSNAASRFVHDLHDGRIDPPSAGFNLPATKIPFDAGLALHRLASSRDVAATLASFEPASAPYHSLKAALAQYRALALQPMLTQLPTLAARSIGQGDEYAGAPQLRRLLVALGDLPSSASLAGNDERIIDIALADALRSFQRRHGLAADGVIGPRTFAALSTPLSQRVLQLELSMERWRWVTPAGRPNIVVNIPQFMLFALPRENEASTDALEMRVIVGETYPRARTPVFTTGITQVVFQPYWDVPRGILIRELLPRLRNDLSLLDRYDMEIVHGEGDDAHVVTPTASALDALAAGTLRLRQRPGPKNALGPVKFVMRNPYNVYLHATPEQALFERTQRTFSHGCIRVSEPRALASYVLRNARVAWDDAAIDAALCRTGTLRVPLARPVKVIVFYATAVATRSEGVLFFQDVYDLDRKLRQLLDERSAVR